MFDAPLPTVLIVTDPEEPSYTLGYAPKPPPLASEPNDFSQAENRRKIHGLAEKSFLIILRLVAEKVQLEPLTLQFETTRIVGKRENIVADPFFRDGQPKHFTEVLLARFFAYHLAQFG